MKPNASKPGRLLLVTSLYPYGTGEAFVTAELAHLSRCFGGIEVVPIFYEPGTRPRPVAHPVDLAYADARWGMLRVLRVAGALLGALARYRWAADLRRILGRDHKLNNLAELLRALYRARMFERYLAGKARAAGVDAQADILYFYWMLPEILGALHFRTANGSSVRIVCRGHNGDLYEDIKPGGYIGLRRSVVDGLDAVYTISDDGTRYLNRCFPGQGAKFHTARLGVEDPGFLNAQPAGGPLSLVSCAFVGPVKRLPLIVDAIAHMLAADPLLEVRWTHVGDGPLFDEVRAYAAGRLGPRAQVVFKGYLTQPELMMLYRDEAFDVIVNVSENEGIPVSLMEAGAVGIPLIATDVGGSAEIVNAENGVLLPAKPNAAMVAAAILRFRDRRAARAWRQAARRHWQMRFDADANYTRFAHTLADLADPKAPAALRPDLHPNPCPDPHSDPQAGASSETASAAAQPARPRNAGGTAG